MQEKYTPEGGTQREAVLHEQLRVEDTMTVGRQVYRFYTPGQPFEQPLSTNIYVPIGATVAETVASARRAGLTVREATAEEVAHRAEDLVQPDVIYETSVVEVSGQPWIRKPNT